MREFDTGATRDADNGKLDYEAFLHPAVLESFATYMHKNRVQADGKLRDGDNWQKGMPKDAYMKSMWRHFMSVWSRHRDQGAAAEASVEDELNALLFNVMGYLYEELVRQGRAARPFAAARFSERAAASVSADASLGRPFKEGDLVRIARKITEQDGWDNVWTYGMDQYQGDVVRVRFDESPSGVPLEVGYSYPPAALDLVHRKTSG